MGLFSSAQVEQINAIASKSKELAAPVQAAPKSINDDLKRASDQVINYFRDSPARVITSQAELHEYVLKCIQSGYAGIDTETTGLDRIRDYIVGWSLYTPGEVEVYIPCKHMVPIFDVPYKGQLTYQECQEELQLLVDHKVKTIFANADFDLAMIYKDLKVDLIPVFYYDVILAWRCLKENELDNTLKGLYAKYPMKGNVDPKKFSDFFSPTLFPYCDPKVAALYAANDAKITYELFLWQLPYVTKTHSKCQKAHLEKIADLVWNVEFPMVAVCAMLHRRGVYLDNTIVVPLQNRYKKQKEQKSKDLAVAVQQLIDEKDSAVNKKRPFRTGSEFNPNSPVHVKYLVNVLLGKDTTSTDKHVLKEIGHPATNLILDVRGLDKLIGTYIDKMPRSVAKDSRVHCSFKSIGAATGRMCIAKGTPITLLNGTKSIEDVVPGDLVYCYDESGTLQLKKVVNVWLTGKDRECVDIKWQSSGKGDIGHLICTPEHRILKKDGTWVRADQLHRHDKVAHLRRVDDTSTHRPQLYGWNGLATREQDVVKYSVFNCKDTQGFVIHHEDRNPSNNELSNLRLMSISEHTRIHSNERLELGTATYSHLLDPEVRSRAQESCHLSYVQKVQSERQHLLEMIQSCNGRISSLECDFNSFKHRCEVAGIDLDSECRKYNPRYHRERIPEDEFKEVYLAFNGLAVRITEHFHISYDKFYRYCNDYGISRNHTIQSVSAAGRYDVYDIEVEDCHNFIASEICVHNSSESPNLQNIPSKSHDIRHMFRATPELYESLDVSGAVTLDSWDLVDIESKGYIELFEVVEGDSLLLESGSVVIQFVHTEGTKVTLRWKPADPSKITIAHPPFVLMSSDFSQQEPKISAFASQEPRMIETFQKGKDIYATISSIAFNVPYEDCLEFKLDADGNKTDETNPEGKARRSVGKVLVLGLNYGMSPTSIGELIFSKDDNMTEEEKTKKAGQIFDAVMTGFPQLSAAIENAKAMASSLGYTETILGRRRHHPDMQLPRFDFVPMKGYMNPDVDPLDPETMKSKDQIPARIVTQLKNEFAAYKYYGQIVKRTKQLEEEHIKVINNSRKIDEASRQTWNAIIQGSAADLTKLAMLNLDNDPEWKSIGGRFLVPVHDELICEVPYSHREKGAEILSRCMCTAGDFLPFKLTCDVETTFRWYGVSVEEILARDKPSSLDVGSLTVSNIEWLQCMLIENEYVLPTFPNPDGSKLMGLAAQGVNGIWSDEMQSCIDDFMSKYNLTRDNFIDFIEAKVTRGTFLQ